MSKLEVQRPGDIGNAFKAAVQDVLDFNNSFDWPEVHTFVYREIDGIKIEADVWVRETSSNEKSESQPAKQPTVLYIHRGGWMAGGRTDFPKPILHEFLTRGFVYVSIDYRLIPEVDFITGQLDDVRVIETWLRDRLQSSLVDRGVNVTVDTDAIVVAGGSAGAHLASFHGWCSHKKAQSSGFGNER
ncbi:uncharacterized protein Z519_05020 [Cladophialophora bantiana CBS 173.52]|uniref:BD-FAE-like domain-containing protein n=1 Tax=Cladophialophora bantiana (strain ATCC 10958 / CBS 173.52 / CDC B-1940 / NIH 8579) TaxID=1442370 RepID=A0A0D2EV13_CLAB1|nr:uncharacterized protein Z519_05020 [Cladophialophora bantiana CBS 173.52]KIW93706.1 hypothetical protein Z519_05020 [Cladophialophora bantiana CBS 173.52]